MTKRESFPEAHAVLHSLRTQLSRAEKAKRKAEQEAASKGASTRPPRPVAPQREAELEGVATDDYSLARAHARLREAVYNSQYHICSHAIQHARAEGFLEHDIVAVLLSGRVRAVYPQDRRWLVCGFFESHGVYLPLHVVVEHHGQQFLDVVTAFVPKQPHHIISRARLALLLRYDDEGIQVRTAPVGGKVGHKGKGKWKRLR